MSDLFDFDRAPDEYAVMGNPIAHSKSPQIHAMFAEQTRQNIRYRAIQVDPGGLAQAVGNFFASGGKGLNITVPFKQDAWHLANELSDTAHLAGAVNTLKPSADGGLFGDNTDGIGLVRDLVQNLGVTLEDKKLLLVGAGGAARGVIAPLLEREPRQLTIVNRTMDRAHELVQHFAGIGRLDAKSFSALDGEHFDVVINATSASLQGDLPPLPVSTLIHAQLVYDMMYGREPTLFLQWAGRQGSADVSDGLGMLVEQAAESFFIWRSVKPDTAPVIQRLRAGFNHHTTAT
ncbi:MAG TPA: shikimate dehydrogenase [Gammaproteobacteria bacterium]